MNRFIVTLLGWRLQIVLIICFSLVAALTVGLNTIVISKVINDYLEEAVDDRVTRDMDLALGFYQLKLDELAAVGQRMVRDPRVIQNLPAAFEGKTDARRIIDEEISRKITVPTLGGTHLIAVLDTEGRIRVGRVLSSEGEPSPPINDGNWGQLPIIATVLSSGEEREATEVIPAEFLGQVTLDSQAEIALVPTDRAAPEPFDTREGTAGLALTGVYPLRDEEDQVLGAVLTAYLFNNDFTLVDRIKEVAGIDTVTIFFGDLRVSTNVMNRDGTRAVGTRVSQEVFDVVLEQARSYVGRAYVVNDWYRTRYEPLRDHRGQVVGSLYVGARESAFLKLGQTFNRRVALIALICIVLAGVIAVPTAKFITRPVAELVDANRRLAQGDMTVRVQAHGSGELAVLGQSFNRMVETLQDTQERLVQTEKLASVGQLAAGVAHEINNPLGSVLLYADILLKETPDDDTQRRRDLDMILREATRCKMIVTDLLNFSRQNEVLTQETDLNALLRDLVKEQSTQELLEKVEVVTDLDPSLPSIEADPLQLRQVFVNLINNAAEAMSQGGQLTLRTHKGPATGFVTAEVEDTGVGIPEENMKKLFTPFFTTKPIGRGTGLGLAITYGIVRMHQGQINVQSQVGQGTTFTITLREVLPTQTRQSESRIVRQQIPPGAPDHPQRWSVGR